MPFPTCSKIFRPHPVARYRGDILQLTSNWFTSAITLGGRFRSVTIDKHNQTVRMFDRRFWFVLSRRTIPFERIKEIAMDDGSAGENWSSAGFEGNSYDLGLVLEDRVYVFLFRIHGSGEFVNNSDMPDWMFIRDRAVETLTAHCPQSEALGLAEQLSALIGVPIGNAALSAP